MSQLGKPILDDKAIDVPFDIDAAVTQAIAGFVAPTKTVSAQPIFTKAEITEGTLTTDTVQVTGFPRKIGAFIDVSQFVPGNIVSVVLQLLFPSEQDWQPLFEFKVFERGFMMDGKTPALESGNMQSQSVPIPDCQARVIVNMKGNPFQTSADIRF